MRGIVFVDDRSAIHVIPRVELRYAEVVPLDAPFRAPKVGDDATVVLRYHLVGAPTARTIEWSGESRPETLKAKVAIGEYNKMAAEYVLAVITRGYRDVHLERRSDNVFLVRDGLVEGDARVVVCRKFITEMALLARQTAIGPLDYTRLQMLHEIHAAARDLILPDWFPIKDEPR